MSVVFEINRDFPYQVSLAFDEAAMDVLDWLEGVTFEWDMYVDLPENSVRYCFRTLGDASAFKQRFGRRRKGELSPADIDRRWLHQVALPARFCERGGYKEIHEFCEGMTLCSRGHSVFDGEWFHVYCFEKPEDAEKFKQRFGGETFDPKTTREGERLGAVIQALDSRDSNHVWSRSSFLRLFRNQNQAEVRAKRCRA